MNDKMLSYEQPKVSYEEPKITFKPGGVGGIYLKKMAQIEKELESFKELIRKDNNLELENKLCSILDQFIDILKRFKGGTKSMSLFGRKEKREIENLKEENARLQSNLKHLVNVKRSVEEEKDKEIETLKKEIKNLKISQGNLKSHSKKLDVDNLKNNLRVLQNTIENIKKLCHNTKGNVIGKSKILKELGE